MSISEPLDDPWADSGPSDRLPASRQRGDGRPGPRRAARPRPGQRRLGRRRPGLRAGAAAGPGRRAVRARRHAAVQGRHRRRRRGPQGPRLLPARARDDLPGDPRPLRQGRAGRPDHRRRRADQARRDHPGRRRLVSAHPRPVGADRGERRVLRGDRPRARRAAPPRRGRHPHHADGIRGRRRRRRDRQHAPRPRSTPSPSSAPARTTCRSATSWRARSTRSRRSARAAAR